MSKVRRLFSQFQPEHYDLQLTLDDQALKFSGRVIIKGRKTGRPAKRLTLHQKGLKITSAKVVKLAKTGPQKIELGRINSHESYDELRLHADQMLYPGHYQITIEFEAPITRPMSGIYPCFFKEDGQEKRLIMTQLESHHAREAFPCLDEPEAKAVFDLTLKTPAANSRVVVGNTPVKKQAKTAKTVTTEFEPTPKMSTYLLAFVYGDMAYKQAKTKDGVTVRAYATPVNHQHVDFALDCAVKFLDFYNDYFDLPYPLPKCDILAMPDFAAGAMENWGCITFREQCMLVDPANTSLGVKQYVANVVAHELTHQWFGNLVTMKWWNDLWLNESFASWMSYLAVDKLFPEWQVWTQFIVDEQSQAMKLDALEHTHPIGVAINHPDEIRTIFDAISYEKGASVLHMLHGWLGADDFRDGLRLYLKKHAYANTTADDLWSAWQQASGRPVKDFMDSWLTQPGYPLVSATITGESEQLSQGRFYLNPSANKQPTVWPVPLGPNGGVTLDKPAVTMKFEAPLPDSSLALLNTDRSSFARVVYNGEYLAKITQFLPRLPELVRFGLLSDAFEAAKAGLAPTLDALRLLEVYKSEDNLAVWEVMAGALGSLKLVMDDEQLRQDLKPYVRGLTAQQLKRLGWKESPKDSHFDKLLRPLILGLAASADEATVVKECQQRFKAMKKPEDIPPDSRSVVYGTVARLGGQAEFDKLWRLHSSAVNSEERVTLAAALTGFEQPKLYKLALSKITTPDVRLQDAMYWVAYSFMNRHARTTTWQWVKDNWDWLKQNLGDDLSFYRLPIYSARVQSSPAFLKDYQTFFAAHMEPALERSVNQGIETIQWQAAWRSRDLAAVKKYFASQANAK